MDNESLIPGVRDFHLLLVMPIAAYWLSASLFHLFDCRMWFQSSKIHSYEAAEKHNKATLPQVFRQVLAQQVIQVLFALALDKMLASSTDPWEAYQGRPLSNITAMPRDSITSTAGRGSSSSQIRILGASLHESCWLVLQFLGATVIADLWQYTWHRVFHMNKFLYKHVHSVHHRLYVPYSYGALSSSLVEAFLVDTIGTTVTCDLRGVSTLSATVFATLSIIKSVNDHSGYRFAYNPFDYLSPNTTDFHDVHHQSWGMKHNFSQIYLTIWDDILGTTMSHEEVAKRRAKAEKTLDGAILKKSE